MISSLNAAVALLALTGATAHLPPIRNDNIVFVNSDAAAESEGCAPDPMGLSARQPIKDAANLLGLSPVSIFFIGCRKTYFQTVSKNGIRRYQITFEIYYPLRVDDADTYDAPITHELGHVFQILAVGSMSRLLNSLDSYRIELGADFIAGLVLARTESMQPGKYHGSMDVLGKYRETSNQHGTPAQRAAAFRLGYFFDRNNRPMAVGEANATFQDDLFQVAMAQR